MPLLAPALASAYLAPNLVSTGNLGVGVPKLAMGIALGVSQFLTAQAKVTTVDVGVLGAGTSVMPMLVATPLIQSALLSSFASMQLMGVMAPKFLMGLSNGLATGLASLALVQTNHPGIGVGTGIARIVGGTAVPALVSGFSAMSMVGTGPTKVATAIGMALDTTFAAYVLPIAIVGSPSIVGGTGVGVGVVL